MGELVELTFRGIGRCTPVSLYFHTCKNLYLYIETLRTIFCFDYEIKNVSCNSKINKIVQVLRKK